MSDDEAPPANPAGTRPRPSLAALLADVLAEQLDVPAGTAPILAKRKRVELRIAQGKKRAADDAALRAVKKASKRRGHVPLGVRAAGAELEDSYDLSLDAIMRQLATRGVVRLFNAVQTAQGVGANGGGGGGGAAGKEGELSKDAFMSMLKRAPTGAAAAPPPQPGAAYLRDDYNFGEKARTAKAGGKAGARLKDWQGDDEGGADDDESDEGDGLGGKGDDDDDDGDSDSDGDDLE